MIKRLSSQRGNENILPRRMKAWVEGGSCTTSRAKINGTNIVIRTGSSTCQAEMCTTFPTRNGSDTGSTSDMTTLLNNTAPTTYSTCPWIKLMITGAAIAVGAMPVMNPASARSTLNGRRIQ